jgi:hypothetical protein
MAAGAGGRSRRNRGVVGGVGADGKWHDEFASSLFFVFFNQLGIFVLRAIADAMERAATTATRPVYKGLARVASAGPSVFPINTGTEAQTSPR